MTLSYSGFPFIFGIFQHTNNIFVSHKNNNIFFFKMEQKVKLDGT